MATKKNEVYKKNFDEMDQYIIKNCEEYAAKCEAILVSVQSKNQDDILTNYREILSFLHDSAGEIRNAITTIFKPSYDSRMTFEAKLDETECDRSREEFRFRSLTKKYKNWHIIDMDHCPPAFRKFRRNPIKPWIGYEDERTAPMFLNEFASKLNWYPDGARIIRKFLSYLQGPDVEFFVNSVDRGGTMETVAKNFYKEFTDEWMFCHEIVEFTKAKCPVSSDKEVLDFVMLWLDKFYYNPKVTMRWVTIMLMNKIPERFSIPLQFMLYREEPLSRGIINRKLMKFERFEFPTITAYGAYERQARAQAEWEAQLEPSSSEESD